MQFAAWRNTRATSRTHNVVEREDGQVLIEVLLILPIFMFLVFSIMEIGHLSFRTILMHHAAYEVARVGSLTATDSTPCGSPGSGGGAPNLNEGKMDQVARRILPGVRRIPRRPVFTLKDPQSGCVNHDVVVELQQAVPMIFPMTGLILGDRGNTRVKTLSAKVQMPIERPLFK